MKILDRYICREVLGASLAILFVLLLILTGNTLLKTVASVVSGELPKDLIFPILGVNMLSQSVILIPMSFFLGVVLAMGRLYQDFEMTAITAGGLGVMGIYRKLLWLLLPLSVLLFCLALFVNAWAVKKKELFWKDAERRAEITSIAPGVFNSNSTKESTLFFERYSVDTAVPKQQLEDVFIQIERGSSKAIQIAQTANKHIDDTSGNVYMQYKKGQLHMVNSNGFNILEFAEHGVLIKEKVYPVYASSEIASLSLSELMDANTLNSVAELQMRIAVPVGAILFILLAVPLSYIEPRKGRYSRLGPAILLYFVYFYLLNLARSWLETGQLAIFPGIFVVIIGIICLLVFFIVKREGRFHMMKNRQMIRQV